MGLIYALGGRVARKMGYRGKYRLLAVSWLILFRNRSYIRLIEAFHSQTWTGMAMKTGEFFVISKLNILL